MSEVKINLLIESYELVKYKKQIFELFEECYARPIDSALWVQFYMQNIYGQPVVALAFDTNGKLVGHYAVVPFYLADQDHVCKSCLSMTTMVSKKSPVPLLFITLAKIVYEELIRQHYDLVFAFPNTNSKLSFQRFLGWKFDYEYYLITFKGEMFQNKIFCENFFERSRLHFINEFSDINWRLNIGKSYENINGLITKEYNGVTDIMLINEINLAVIDHARDYNVICTKEQVDMIEAWVKYKIYYPLGYKSFNSKVYRFKPDLFLSDVF